MAEDQKDKQIAADNPESYIKHLEELDELKSRFYENVNHDLRTPLMLIEGYVLRILEDEDTYLSSKSEADFEKLQRNLQLIRALNNQLNDLSLLEKGKLKLSMEKVHLQSYIDEIVDLFKAKAEAEGKSLSFKSDAGPKQEVILDRHQFSRVIFNILNNALQYTPENGKILVILQSNIKKSEFTICVYNTGEAISHDVLPHLFDRFYRGQQSVGRSNVKGMGIGLELTKEITLLHGGSIMADSLTHEGTCFFISIPFNLDHEVEEDVPVNTTAYVKPIPKAKKDTQTIHIDEKRANILIVDDNQEIREYIRDILGGEYATDEAENGQIAMEKIEKGFYDLVIADLMMPWMDGFELLQNLNQEKYNGIPVMIVSSRTSESDKLKVLDDGALDFMTKPFNPKELSSRIANILKHKRSWNAFQDIGHTHKSQIEKDLLIKLKNVILQHIGDPKLSVALIADELCTAERSAYRMIKTLTGKTPLDYIKSLRYEYAYEILSKGQVKSLSEAARSIGISNATYFSSQFQKRYGVSPDSMLK